MARFPALLLGLAASLLVAACGEASSPPPAAPGAAAAAPPAPVQRTVTHILIAYQGARGNPTTTRSKEQALEVAKSLLRDLAGGRSFEDLVQKFTDDRDPQGKPNTNNGKPGSYTWPTPKAPRPVPEFEKASKELPVGKVTPEPVETPFGFHLIRRDA